MTKLFIEAMEPRTDAASSGPRQPRNMAAIAVLAATMLVVLDAAIANVALPTFARWLHATPGMSMSIVIAYQMAMVMALLPCAALGESLGYRRVFTAGVVLFTAASALCSLSPSLPWLVAARFLQGLGGAAVMALGVALLRLAVPDRQLGAAIGWNALVIALSAAAGPTIGAMILSGASWPWLFAVNLPLGLLVLLATRALPHLAGTARRLDFVSVALNAGSFAALVVGAELLPTKPALAAVLLVASAFGLRVLVRREMPKEAPLIPLDLLGVGSFRISVIASVCCFTGQTAATVALPFYLQHGLGQSTLTTGLFMTCWPLTMAITAPIAGRLANCVSTAWLCATGGTCLAIGLAATSLWPLQSGPPPLALAPFVMLCGLGFGLFNVPNNRNMFLSAPSERSGSAGGMQGTARVVGQTAGALMMTLLFTLTSAEAAPRIGLGIGSLLTLAAGLVSALRVNLPDISVVL
jgi:DHA2 family multidrug resistance protein-like MFS transporter